MLRRQEALPQLRAGVAGLHPGYFAVVMATGIVSMALDTAGVGWLSAILLWVTIGCFLVLAAAYG
ncbi:MAG: hypothetical protein J2P33_04365, partial [Actinobacteria bacterium]|nr:hypothetical protein [Actinomycetota bacterium]